MKLTYYQRQLEREADLLIEAARAFREGKLECGGPDALLRELRYSEGVHHEQRRQAGRIYRDPRLSERQKAQRMARALGIIDSPPGKRGGTFNVRSAAWQFETVTTRSGPRLVVSPDGTRRREVEAPLKSPEAVRVLADVFEVNARTLRNNLLGYRDALVRFRRRIEPYRDLPAADLRFRRYPRLTLL